MSPSSNDKNAEIVRLDVMIRVRTSEPPLCVCEFVLTLSSRLSTKKNSEGPITYKTRYLHSSQNIIQRLLDGIVLVERLPISFLAFYGPWAKREKKINPLHNIIFFINDELDSH